MSTGRRTYYTGFTSRHGPKARTHALVDGQYGRAAHVRTNIVGVLWTRVTPDHELHTDGRRALAPQSLGEPMRATFLSRRKETGCKTSLRKRDDL